MNSNKPLLELIPVSVPHGFEEAIDYGGTKSRPRWLGCFPQHNYKHLRLVDSNDRSEYGNYDAWVLFAEHAINRIPSAPVAAVSDPNPESDDGSEDTSFAFGANLTPVKQPTKPTPAANSKNSTTFKNPAYLLDRHTRLLFQGETETVEKYLKTPLSLELLSNLYCQAFPTPQFIPIPVYLPGTHTQTTVIEKATPDPNSNKPTPSLPRRGYQMPMPSPSPFDGNGEDWNEEDELTTPEREALLSDPPFPPHKLKDFLSTEPPEDSSPATAPGPIAKQIASHRQSGFINLQRLLMSLGIMGCGIAGGGITAIAAVWFSAMQPPQPASTSKPPKAQSSKLTSTPDLQQLRFEAFLEQQNQKRPK